MKNKKTIIIIAGAIFVIGISAIIGIGLLGDKPQTKQDIESLIQKNEMIEIEIAVPEDNEQGEIKELDWTILAQLTTYQDTLRTPFDKLFFVRVDNTSGEKIGRPYFNAAGENIQNNTFINACQNKLFMQTLNKTETLQSLSDMACSTYADLEVDDVYTNALMALNGYFNLLPDATPNYANPNSTLSRAEYLALLTRASIPVTELTINTDFEKLVGKCEYNIYAQESEKFAYLNSSDSSINDKTYTGTISRAEAIYAIVSMMYPDELANADLSGIESMISISDIKDGGDIAKEQGFADKNYSKSYELVWALNNPDGGIPTPLYRAIVIAAKYGIVDYDSEVNWDSGITKSEAIDLVLKAARYSSVGTEKDDNSTNNDYDYSNGLGTDFSGTGIGGLADVHPAYRSEWGTFDIGLDEAGLTREEDLEDGILGFQVVIHEDGTSHVVCNLDGSTYNHGELLPDGNIYIGTQADKALAMQQTQDAIRDAMSKLNSQE